MGMKRTLAALTLLTLLLTGCGETKGTVSLFAMDTYMELTASGTGAQAALEEAAAEIRSLDQLLSVTDPDSDVYRLNQTGSAQVSPDTAELLEQSLALSAGLGDAFDLTIYPVSRAWGFTTGSYQVPSDAELQALLPLVDDSRVTLNGTAVTLPQGAELDLGAAAKGYAGDRAVSILRDRGISSALLNLGASTICAVGSKPDGSPWRIAIQDPEHSEDFAGILEITDQAVNTSGGYERFFEQDGQVYWHILDPTTGAPARSGLLSATAVTEDALTGDILSTALFVMGPERAEAYWRSTGGFEYVLIGTDRIYLTEGIADRFTPQGSYAQAELVVLSRQDEA